MVDEFDTESDSCALLANEEGPEDSSKDSEPLQETNGSIANSGCHPCCTCALRLFPVLRALRQRCGTLRGWWGTQEVVALCKLAVPIVVMLFFQQLLFLVSLLFVGHITGESLELDAAGLGYSFVNVTGTLIGIGLATAADTLCSQTYGFKDYKAVGVVLQRGLLILAVAMFPIWVLWLNAEPILLLLQQPPCVARIAAQYVKVFCLALPSIFLYTMLQKYLQAQGIVWIFALVGLCMNLLGAALHGILINAAKLGVVGAAAAMVISYSSAPLLLLIYIRLRQLHRQTWGGWSWESLKGWGQFARLGAPGLMMIMFEWCSIEVSAFVAGAIDQTQLAINAIVITVLNIIYMIPLGFSIAATFRVGNELGAGNPVGARRASYATIAVVLCNSTITCTVLLSSKTVLGKLFTEDQLVIEGVSRVITVVAFMEFSDGIQAAVAGILRGSGRQLLGAIVNFLSYFVLGLPLAIVLALPAGLGTLGIWIALASANFIQAGVYLVAVWRTDWERQAQQAQKEAMAAGRGEGQIEGLPQGEGEGGEWQREGSQEKDVELEAKPEGSTSTSAALAEDVNRTAEGDMLLCQETEAPPTVQTFHRTAEGDMLLCQETEAPPTVQTFHRTAEGDMLLCQEAEDPPTVQTFHRTCCTRGLRLKLLFYRGSFFLAGIVLLVAGGLASLRLHYPLADTSVYDNCSNSSEATSRL